MLESYPPLFSSICRFSIKNFHNTAQKKIVEVAIDEFDDKFYLPIVLIANWARAKL